MSQKSGERGMRSHTLANLNPRSRGAKVKENGPLRRRILAVGVTFMRRVGSVPFMLTPLSRREHATRNSGHATRGELVYAVRSK
jgi:hypothetical protein